MSIWPKRIFRCEHWSFGTFIWIFIHSSSKIIGNEDDECFKWAVTSAVYTAKKHPERLNEKMRENSETFNWKGINFSFPLNQINRFERQTQYAINVFWFEKEKVYPLRISQKESRVIGLMLISNEETNHYCWIKNKSKKNILSTVLVMKRLEYNFPRRRRKKKRRRYSNLRITTELCGIHS